MAGASLFLASMALIVSSLSAVESRRSDKQNAPGGMASCATIHSAPAIA